MNPDNAFLLANGVALVGWAALLAAPLIPRSAVAIARWAGVALALGYVVLLASSLGHARGLAGDYSLQGIAGFFSVPALALAGWVHYLAFDLWVGAWEVEEGRRTGVPHLLLVPALLLTFLLGPVGLLVFLAIRRLRRRHAPSR